MKDAGASECTQRWVLYPSLGAARPPKAGSGWSGRVSQASQGPSAARRASRLISTAASDLARQTSPAAAGPAGLCRSLCLEHIGGHVGFKAMLAWGWRDPPEEAGALPPVPAGHSPAGFCSESRHEAAGARRAGAARGCGAGPQPCVSRPSSSSQGERPPCFTLTSGRPPRCTYRCETAS